MSFRSSQLARFTLLACVSSFGCAANPSVMFAPRELTLTDRVIVGRDTVAIRDYWSVVDLLAHRLARFSAGNSLSRTPLVVVDGLPRSDGMESLRSIRAADVQQIELLWPAEAAQRYGGLGADGAIVIRSRRGSR
jgi:hypothetical protein